MRHLPEAARAAHSVLSRGAIAREAGGKVRSAAWAAAALVLSAQRQRSDALAIIDAGLAEGSSCHTRLLSRIRSAILRSEGVCISPPASCKFDSSSEGPDVSLA